MPRPSIEMTPEEVRDFVGERNTLIVGFTAQDSAPAAAIAHYQANNGRIEFALSQDSEAAQSIRRDPRVCAIIEQNPSYDEIQAVVLYAAAGMAEAPENAGYACFQIDLESAKVVSFDFRKVAR